MTAKDIVKAWRDPMFRTTDGPANPAGMVELSGTALDVVTGGGGGGACGTGSGGSRRSSKSKHHSSHHARKSSKSHKSHKSHKSSGCKS